MANNIYVTFECCRDGRVSNEFGPFEYVQIVYNRLTVGPNGNDLAVLDPCSGDWFLVDGSAVTLPWSDFVVSSRIEKVVSEKKDH